MSKLITTDDVFRDVRNDPEFEAEHRRIAPRTNLAINVNRLRNAKGWTQETLANAAGMRQPRIAEIERGDANPRLDTITRIAIALGVSDADLLDDPDLARREGRKGFHATTVLRVVEPDWKDSPLDWRRVAGAGSRTAANDNFALVS